MPCGVRSYRAGQRRPPTLGIKAQRPGPRGDGAREEAQQDRRTAEQRRDAEEAGDWGLTGRSARGEIEQLDQPVSEEKQCHDDAEKRQQP